jgi:hypothetical protein
MTSEDNLDVKLEKLDLLMLHLYEAIKLHHEELQEIRKRVSLHNNAIAEIQEKLIVHGIVNVDRGSVKH